MADERQDASQKTEEPTQRRLEQAREKGQIAKSQEVSHWFMILAVTIVVGVLGAAMTEGLAGNLYRFVEQAHAIRLDGPEFRAVLAATLGDLALVLLLPMVAVVAATVASGVVQNGLVFSAEAIKPKLEKLSLVKGIKRLFSTRSLFEFTKGLIKIGIVAMVSVLLVWPEWRVIPQTTGMSMVQFMTLVQDLALRILIGVLSVMTVIAGLDFLYQKQQHLKQLRMSKQELKEEFKQTEGDPMVKARLRQIRMERARRRMMAAVPDADVVITNPTHFAVALKYDMEKMEAPRVTAKGADAVALRIREIAEEHGVTVVENPPLTRALYESVDLDREIPPEHYKAVAEVIGYVMGLKGRMPRQSTRRLH